MTIVQYTRLVTGILLGAVIAATGCRPGEHLEGAEPPVVRPVPVPGAPAPSRGNAGLPRNEPNVRIGIALDTPSAQIGSPVEFDVRTVDGRSLAHADPGAAWTFSVFDGRIIARAGERVVVEGAAPPVRIVPRDLPFVTINGRTYRGEVLLITRGSHLTAVNVTDMESYLLGVVPRELGKRPAGEIEALKAQAVAARTYAIGNMNGHADQGFDFYATVLDQVYGGTADEDSIVSRAVRETRGEIITYDGAPILAYYSSTCGGTTAAIEESWPSRAPLPYLRSRSDRVPGTDDEYYCSSSSRFRWKTEWTRQQLLDAVSSSLRAHTRGAVGSVRAINRVRIADTSPSGRVNVEITADGRKYLIRADSVRYVLRTPTNAALLNSSRIYTLDTDGGGDDGVDHLTIEGGGWGHGIGMCQVGAMARARAGQKYRDILGAYYTGVKIEPLYD